MSVQLIPIKLIDIIESSIRLMNLNTSYILNQSRSQVSNWNLKEMATEMESNEWQIPPVFEMDEF